MKAHIDPAALKIKIPWVKQELNAYREVHAFPRAIGKGQTRSWSTSVNPTTFFGARGLPVETNAADRPDE
eukprot:2667719-Pleurochrysis_carterae.AAC.1